MRRCYREQTQFLEVKGDCAALCIGEGIYVCEVISSLGAVLGAKLGKGKPTSPITSCHDREQDMSMHLRIEGSSPVAEKKKLSFKTVRRNRIQSCERFRKERKLKRSDPRSSAGKSSVLTRHLGRDVSRVQEHIPGARRCVHAVDPERRRAGQLQQVGAVNPWTGVQAGHGRACRTCGPHPQQDVC